MRSHPDDAFRLTREQTGDLAAAAKVRFRVWEAQTRALDDETFKQAAHATAADDVMSTDYFADDGCHRRSANGAASLNQSFRKTLSPTFRA
ncbi:MAG: hypothetical protein ABIR67_11130 [Gaiellaceae bacterium]